MKKKTDILDYFSPESRDERREERVKNASKVSGTFNKLSERYTASRKLTTQNAGLSAVAMVRNIISHYRLPSEPKLGYSGLRNVRTAANSSKVTDGVVVVTASVRTPTNVYINFDVPIEIRNGELLEPSVIVHNGAPRVIAQSTFDEITTRHTAHEIMPVREMYSKPLDKKVSDQLYSQRVKTTRKMPGMFSVKANRDAIRRAISIGADMEVEIEKVASDALCKPPKCKNSPGTDGLCDMHRELMLEEDADFDKFTFDPADPESSKELDNKLVELGLIDRDDDKVNGDGDDVALEDLQWEVGSEGRRKKLMAQTAVPAPKVPKPKMPNMPKTPGQPKPSMPPGQKLGPQTPKAPPPPKVKVETPKPRLPPNVRKRPDRKSVCKKCLMVPCKCEGGRKKSSLQEAFARAAKSVLNHDIKFKPSANKTANADAISFKTMDDIEGLKNSINVNDDDLDTGHINDNAGSRMPMQVGGKTVYVDSEDVVWSQPNGGKRLVVDVSNEEVYDAEPGDYPSAGADALTGFQRTLRPGDTASDDSFGVVPPEVDKRVRQPPHANVPRKQPVTARMAKEEKKNKDDEGKDDKLSSKGKKTGPDLIKKQLADYIDELIDSGVQDIDIKLMLGGNSATGKKPMFDKAGPDVISEIMGRLFGDRESSFSKTGPEKKTAAAKCICTRCGDGEAKCGRPVEGASDKCQDCNRGKC